MNKEKDFIALTSIVAIGVVVISGLAAILQKSVLIYVAIFGVVMFPLLLLQNRSRISHITENLEKAVFFVTLIIIALSFIVLFKPM